ncbi:hypothetical protein L580_2808 [Serratia fonticola AU-P3(3)]|nr:hypothetical protein L580_2808 [Serratia fonticola AU-P3(3)]
MPPASLFMVMVYAAMTDACSVVFYPATVANRNGGLLY